MVERESSGFWTNLARLYALLEPRRKREIWLLVLITIAGAFAEVVTIGAVVPFLALLANSGGRHISWIQPVFAITGVASHQAQLLMASAVLCTAAVCSALLRILLSWKTQEFVFAFGHGLSVEIQRRMLMQPYEWHVQHNSSDQLAAIEKAQLVTASVLLPLVQATAASFLVLVVFATLLAISPTVTGVTAVTLGIAYLALGAFARRRFERNSSRINRAFEQRIRIVQEGLTGIRDVILDNSQALVLERFRLADRDLARSSANNSFVSTVPRYLIESAGIVVIAGVALVLSIRPGGILAALPILGAIALGAQRLLPLIQQVFNGWSNFAANNAILGDVAAKLDLPTTTAVSSGPRLEFKRSIEFRNVGFTYAQRNRPAVSGISLEIDRGSRLVIVGPTGSGKSTLADMVMGLLEPTEGEILVDGVPLTPDLQPGWRRNIAHVPQLVLLADASIAENIALGLPPEEIDDARVAQAADRAQLHDFITSLPEGYDAKVGERGIRLSGGQRQRLGIARAIYKDAELLILDEATNALDHETEAKVLQAIHEFGRDGRTLITISHRPAAALPCDVIVRLQSGRLVDLGPFHSSARRQLSP